MLLSPLGCKGAPENFQWKNIRYRTGGGPPTWLRALANALWGRVSPLTLLQFRSEAKVRQMLTRYIGIA